MSVIAIVFNMPKIQCKCANCGKSVFLYQCQIVERKLIHCSRECYRINRSKQMTGGSYKSTLISNSQALDDLRNLYHELDRYPTAKDVNDKWPHRSILYGRRFGTVKRALEIIGVFPPPVIEIIKLDKPKKLATRKVYSKTGKVRPTYTRDQLINELIRVANLLGHTPTDIEFREYGSCSTGPYWNKFGSWANACRLANLEPHTTFEGGYYSVDPHTHIRKWDNKTVILTGTYELRFARKMDDMEWRWLCQKEYLPIQYIKDQKSHRYIPDFYIPHLGIYIETKGWFRDKVKVKMALVIEQNPSLPITIIGRYELEYFEKTGNLP